MSIVRNVNEFVVRVTATELQNHLFARAKYHQERAAYYRSEVKRHEDVMKQYEDDRLTDTDSKVSYNNAQGVMKSAQNGLQKHAAIEKNFTFFANHLAFDDYHLTMSECQVLELTRPEGNW